MILFLGEIIFNNKYQNSKSYYIAILNDNKVEIKYKTKSGSYNNIYLNIKSEYKFLDVVKNLEISSYNYNPININWNINFQLQDSVIIFCSELNRYNNQFFTGLNNMINHDINIDTIISYIKSELIGYKNHLNNSDLIIFTMIWTLYSHFSLFDNLNINDIYSIFTNNSVILYNIPDMVLLDNDILQKMDNTPVIEAYDITGKLKKIPLLNDTTEIYISIIPISTPSDIKKEDIKLNYQNTIDTVNHVINNGYYTIKKKGEYILFFKGDFVLSGEITNSCSTSNNNININMEIYTTDSINNIIDPFTSYKFDTTSLNKSNKISTYVNINVNKNMIPYNFYLILKLTIENYNSISNLIIDLKNVDINIMIN